MNGSNSKRISFITLLLLSLTACQTTQEKGANSDERIYYLKKSLLEGESGFAGEENTVGDSEETIAGNKQGFTRLQPIAQHNTNMAEKAAQNVFGKSEDIRISANDMPVTDFIHYVFGDLFKTNYVIDNGLKADATPVTLNVQNPMSQNELYALVANLLAQNRIRIEFNENTFFFHRPEDNRGSATVAVGRELSSVPNVGGQILQVVQFNYGIRITLERTLNRLVDAEFIPDFDQNSMFILGNRQNVIRALELINMLDVPAHRGKYIGLLSLEYIGMEDFTTQAITLLTNEGVDAAVNTAQNKSVLLVPLGHIGAIAVFASSEESLERVRYWANVLDRPSQGENAQYFIYAPKYARAKDLGESIQGLLGISTTKVNTESTGNNAKNLASGRAASASASIAGLSFVVDERTNNLIFNTTGDRYLKLLPLLQKLDVLPKQILLEVMIAEVTLTDNFKFGVEFALQNDERFTATTQGRFGLSDTGGLSISLLDQDFLGSSRAEAALALFKQNQFVNVLSNPTLLVRDGMTASINVGTEIPTQGSLTVDDGVQTSSINYRETGVQVQVTPTLNAQGVVIMNIAQTISNVVEGTAGSPTPSIFNRSLSTEAVVESGRTVILGGLISESNSRGETKVPILGDIPLIGKAFKSENDATEKTELVMIVTPKVIRSSDEWDKLISEFSDSLETIKLGQ
ncbi:type II secretory pathway protein [Planctobacterium marinum]|uniref:Type II secretion system protein GspD n=1 Tax=Planctobacterium marinum TaxID=1631968 RepID=A0AA48HJQ1_9ALTE|nr:type II secretion system protein GspD [Planctobacterium marinum]